MEKKIPSKEFKYIFGPVYSWRLGISLGIDPLSQDDKSCNFNCSYCQLGRTKVLCQKRKIFVPTSEIIEEIKEIPIKEIDYITFAGRGEPTLAKNLGDLIRAVRRIHPYKIAVITNGALIKRTDVQHELALADFLLVKLDAACQKDFWKINRAGNVKLVQIIIGIKAFKKIYQGRLGLQIMFVPANKEKALALATIARAIDPDEIQLNTPLRKSLVKPLSKDEMEVIRSAFKGFNVKMVYDYEQQDVKPIDKDSMVKRHGTPA